MNDKFSMVVFSGTVDRLMAASIMATGAAAMGKKVRLFLTFWGLMAFRKGDWQTNRRISKDFEDLAEAAAQAMAARKVPSWLETLQGAMEVGDVTVEACGMTMDLFGLKLDDLEPVVTGISGVANFVNEIEGGQVLFI